MRRNARWTRRTPLVLLMATWPSITGCAPAPISESSADTGPGSLSVHEPAERTGRQVPPRSGAAATRRGGPLGAAVATENGLEVRKIVVQDREGTLVPTLADLGQRYAGDGAARMKRNGFELVRLSEEDLDGLLDRLRERAGEPLTDLRTWFGQAPGWRDLLRLPARSPIGVVVDGRPRVLSDGTIRLLIRAWTLPVEDGAMLEVQLRAQFDPTMRGTRLLTGPRAAGASEQSAGEPLGGTLDMLLGPGEVWALTCVHPRDVLPTSGDGEVRRDGLPARAASRDSSTRSDLVDSSAASAAGTTGAAVATGGMPRERQAVRGPQPDDLHGPGAALPSTIGALLLSTEIPATRTLYLLLPRLPSVTLPDRAAEAESTGEDDSFDSVEPAAPPPEPRLRGGAR